MKSGLFNDVTKEGIMGTGSFPGVKRSGSGVDRPPLSSAEVEGRVELYIHSPSGSSCPVLGRTLPKSLTYSAVRDTALKVSKEY